METGPTINVIVYPAKMYPVREASSHAASHEHALRSGGRYFGDGLALCRGGLAHKVSDQSSARSQTPALAVRSNVVLVPALVKTKSGELVFALTADDFILTDNGVPQALRLDLIRIRSHSRWRSSCRPAAWAHAPA